jgi:arginine repressor
MAKKSSGGNKSQAIREALQSNPDASPKEIAEKVQAQGFKVTPAYVSIVKYNQSKSSGAKGRKVRVKRSGQRAGGSSSEGSHTVGNSLQSALEFIRACGGLEQAKSVLATVEQIRSAV